MGPRCPKHIAGCFKAVSFGAGEIACHAPWRTLVARSCDFGRLSLVTFPAFWDPATWAGSQERDSDHRESNIKTKFFSRPLSPARESGHKLLKRMPGFSDCRPQTCNSSLEEILSRVIFHFLFTGESGERESPPIRERGSGPNPFQGSIRLTSVSRALRLRSGLDRE
jgi:hypothetical protein